MLELQAVLDVQEAVMSTIWSQDLAVSLARWAIYLDVLLAWVLMTSKSKKDVHAVYEGAWSAALALTLTTLIALVIGRLRPFLASPDVTLLIPAPFNSSFPSGHTATVTAVAFAFIWARRDVGWAAFVVAAAVALGRLMAGVHYPSDLIGGLCVGALSFGLVRIIHHQVRRGDIKRRKA